MTTWGEWSEPATSTDPGGIEWGLWSDWATTAIPDPTIPVAVPGADASNLTSPAARAGKGQRWAWSTGTRWDAVLPTGDGWRIYTDLAGAMTPGPVVDSRPAARVDTLWHVGTLWVLTAHTSTPVVRRYVHSGGSYVLDGEEDVPALAAANLDASPAVLYRTPNGRLWAAVANGSNVVVAISDDDGDNWSTANVASTSEPGAVTLAHSGTTLVLVAMLNDSAGRIARTIPQGTGSITAVNWTSETLPALPGGTASDDHGMAVAGPDGHIYVASKTEGAISSAQPLLYLLHRTPGGTWTSRTLRAGPDAGETRPHLLVAGEWLYHTFGSFDTPTHAWIQILRRSNVDAVPDPDPLFQFGDFGDSVIPPRHVTLDSGILWLAHNRADGSIWRVLADVEPPDVPVQLQFALAGAVTDSSAVVKARLTQGSADIPLLVSESPDLANPVQVFGEPVADDVWQFDITDLNPDTTYHYGIHAPVGRFHTFPPEGQPGSFTIAAASCNQTSSNATVFDRIRERDPLFFLHMGDWGYPDIAVNNISLYYQNYRNNLTQPRQRDLFARVPIAYVWDDHDFGPNNATGSHVGKPAAQQAYREYVPHYELPANTRPGGNGEIYQTFLVRRVRFVLLDIKSERDEEDDPDGPSKTCLGADQKQWLKDTLLAATEPLIVIDVSEPWIGSDGWGMYATERAELADFFEANNLTSRLLLIHGDAHMIAADDGTNTQYADAVSTPGPPLFCFAPLDRSNSVKGGPYSEGTRTGSQNQYGSLEFVDDGELITVTGRGWQVSGGSESNVLTMQAVYGGDAPTPEARIFLGDGTPLRPYVLTQGGLVELARPLIG